MKSVPASDFRTYIMPAGSVIPFAGSFGPTGFLLCDGSGCITNYLCNPFYCIGRRIKPGGLGDGGTFNVPDLRGRVVAGF